MMGEVRVNRVAAGVVCCAVAGAGGVAAAELDRGAVSNTTRRPRLYTWTTRSMTS